jgi:uncharacterized SAM-binding protein YcdF (DUF218 family)
MISPASIVGFFSVPSNVIALLALCGLVSVALWRPRRATLVGVGLGAFGMAAFLPIGTMLLTPLEQRFPERTYPQQAIDGIIVLGGSYDSRVHGYLNTIFIDDATGPVAAIVDLARRYPRAQIIFSGGTDPSSSGPSEAAIGKKIFTSYGIAADRILIEERSLTTEENARFTAELVHPTPQSRWLLVTFAYHMPRAMATFRRAGFNVLAFPVGWRTRWWEGIWLPAKTAAENLRRIDVAAHEWLGLIGYRLMGYSNEWVAGP